MYHPKKNKTDQRPTFHHRSGLRGTHLGGSFVAFQNATVAVDAPLPAGLFWAGGPKNQAL